MEQEIQKCAKLLLEGKVIAYPTDTVWGIGCDATNEEAVSRIYRIKQRNERKSMIILLDSAERLPMYVKKIPLIAWDLLSHVSRPTTFVYPTAQNLPKNLVHSDGTIAIRVTSKTSPTSPRRGPSPTSPRRSLPRWIMWCRRSLPPPWISSPPGSSSLSTTIISLS